MLDPDSAETSRDPAPEEGRMLSAQDNEYMSRVGPGTPMGAWLRRFWTPLMLSSDLPEPDCEPREVRMLGEDLVAFRATDGRVGTVAALCPHRQAPLVYGRNEDDGLRCIYHGWKFAVDGRCLDMPSEPAASNFKDKIRARSYPTSEAAGIVWIYMGPQHLKPELPDMEWMRVPDSYRNMAKFNLEGNWVQAMEGDVDSSHIGFLHRNLRDLRDPVQAPPDIRYQALDRAPKWSIFPTDYGMMIAARRQADEDTYYWRINQVMLPYYTFVAGPLDQSSGLVHIWVPTDDYNSDIWTVMWRVRRPMTAEEREGMFGGPRPHIASYDPATGRLRANKANHFFQDRRVQKTETFSGIPGIREQDGAVTLGMGPIVDRTQEHLGTSDTAVIALRRMLIRAAQSLEAGQEPYAPYHGDVYRKRSWSAVLQVSDDLLGDPEAQRLNESLVP
jgi:phenylpropionate dioxygenase-like ring-hydroxylating dioxygenase large terminal subunit